MVLKSIFAACFGIALLAWNGPSRADEYRPGEFLKLDLQQAVLSPKRLGPPAQFEPMPVEAKAEPAIKAPPVHVAKVAKPVRTAKPHIAVATKLVRRHGNPLDAQAFDTRIQVWPCKSGGICNWRR
jgi:hypothetical protein